MTMILHNKVGRVLRQTNQVYASRAGGLLALRKTSVANNAGARRAAQPQPARRLLGGAGKAAGYCVALAMTASM